MGINPGIAPEVIPSFKVPKKNNTLVKVNLSDSPSSFVWLWYGILKDIPNVAGKIQRAEKEELSEVNPPEKADLPNETTGKYFCNLDISKSDLWYFFQKYTENVPTDMLDSKVWENLTVNMKIGLNDFTDIFQKCKNQPCSIPITNKKSTPSNITNAFTDMATFSELSKQLFEAFPSSSIDKYLSHYLPKDDLDNPNNASAAFATVFLRSSNGGNFDDDEMFFVTRAGDFVSHTALKLFLPALPPGLKWKSNIYSKIVRSIEFRANELPVSGRSGIDNLNDIESSGLWPKYINCYNKLTPEEQYIASSTPMYIVLPLMLPWQHSSKWTLPSVALPFNEIRIVVRYGKLTELVDGPIANEGLIKRLESKLECDYIVVNNDIRPKVARDCVNCHSRKIKEPYNDGLQRCSLQSKTVITTNDSPEDKETPGGKFELEGSCNCVRPPGRDKSECNKSERDKSWLGKMVDSSQEEKGLAYQEGKVLEKSKGDSSEVSSPLSLPTTLRSHAFPIVQHQLASKSFVNGNVDINVNLRFSHKISGLILTFYSDIVENLPPQTIIYPFNYAEIIYENNCRWAIHAADARDYLWRKCGRKPPKNQHSFLIPFSPEMFDYKNCPIGPDFSRLSNVSLNIQGNELWEGTKWNVEVSALTTNYVVIAGGSMGFPLL